MRKFKELMESRFEIKTTIVADSPEEQKEGRGVNRIVRITEHGWEYEPDQRHADMIIEAMGLQNSKGVSTPAEEEKAWEEETNNDVVCWKIHDAVLCCFVAVFVVVDIH